LCVCACACACVCMCVYACLRISAAELRSRSMAMAAKAARRYDAAVTIQCLLRLQIAKRIVKARRRWQRLRELRHLHCVRATVAGHPDPCWWCWESSCCRRHLCCFRGCWCASLTSALCSVVCCRALSCAVVCSCWGVSPVTAGATYPALAAVPATAEAMARGGCGT
jgi:hypothetical protein